MRCPRCGNENLDQNRFCGMCGASLLPPPEPVSVRVPAPSASESAAAPAPAEARRSQASVSNTPPSISGPSFLGLNDSSAGRPVAPKRASLSIDPHSGPRSNLDYLLDDEEPPHHWGIGKILLILIALALAVGFGYLRFKNQGVAWLSALKKPTAAVAQNSPATDTTSTPAPTPGITPEPQPPAQPAATAPPPAASGPANAPASNTAATPAPEGTAPANPPPPTEAAKPTDTTPAASPDKTAAPTDTSPADKNTTAAKEPAPETPATATKPVEKPRPASPKTPAPKPSAATKPAASYDPVAEAQKYLYGRGAPQDCDRGMRLLKPAANQGNAKAMVEMGALYSAGLCTPHDLPTAYRWFAMALRKDPESTTIQADLQKLWSEMTQPERQLAIKLTQ